MSRRFLAAVAVLAAVALAPGAAQAPRPPGSAPPSSQQLAALVSEALAVSVPTRSPAEYADAARRYRAVLDRLKAVEAAALDLDDQVDRALLEAHVRTRLFEIETIRLHEVDPASYIALGQTSGLFLRPEATGDADIRRAAAEMSALPAVLASARANLKTPAGVWTENAIYQAYYGRMLLDDHVPGLRPSDPDLARELAAAAGRARAALADYADWLERELLPRSTRAPAWTPDEIEFYQFVHEQLDEYGVDEMIRIAEAEERQLTEEMAALARRIHPSGDLGTVWELMKQEAPPWEGVLPMAQRYVEMASAWLKGPGRHVVTIPDYIDYGARLTPPMARRALSFGGASQGPTVAGRQSGYYVITPLEERLTPEERTQRLKSYNPYWTHVISYHEWLGHNVQIAARVAHVTRPMRRAFRSIYFSQAWSFYLEKLLEDEGYYDGLPYMEALKTRMARRQLRMWRVQRILTKCRMAKGQMTFDEAVQAYVDRIGMEPANAYIEVQRDSQSPSPPGREIIGERAILTLREEYRRRMGPHDSLLRFNDTLLTYGDLPFRQIRRLMFRE
jgi:uncharacterized protein (DUF885 family)